ncbi:MAG: PspA/IM30 family protein [Hydrogenophaga sp.]|jgi:phage shock protein A|uniref:PspA/IM30 family protein n=1 Tax=Hydrogenophaga sp. TaxID=1904254 RepID=UPI00272379E9|nr:PspA/IM30 family protein [Hydrogenophaga sp.]MDO9201367.1 PspA/IM30 family protein [Hydrogenophaga sp.]MDO9483615.1 PspA/IM30 family protein [Hydrogenophaga sp.]MDO9570425.1 PspA/IM30 family protein [Hydrogenophaga sp.]MDP1893176.1 PspA/IM30 family protein [Hydrogenophaga sp.]MDP3345444.1 PspA/IM30 family protein [Hydrogenophaga sp.]
MANNAIFARLANLWTGFISLWVSDIEKEHPEIAYQNAISSMIQKYTQLKAATGAIIARRQEITSRLQASERELAAVSTDLEAAMATNQDDLAVVLIQKKNALDAAIAELRADAAQATADADGAKDSLIQVKSEIDKLKAEKERMLAQMHSAQARIKIQGQLDGLSVDAEVQALGAVRDHIKSQVAQASLGAELQSSDLDVRLNKLRQSSGSVTAKAQLEAMKQARAAAQAAPTKTL